MPVTLDELKKYKEKNQGVTQLENNITLDDLKKYKTEGSLTTEKKDKTSFPPSPKTSLDQSRYNAFGQSIIPRYQEDKPLAAIGKDVVNYGAGTLLRGMSGGTQALMQLVSNTGNIIQGKPLDFSQKTLRNDILPKEYGQAVDDLASKGAVGQLASGFIQGATEGALSMESYVGGGIIDDLAKAGQFGKSATLGTTENLLSNAKINSKVAKKIPLTVADELKPTIKPDISYVDQYGNVVNDVNKKPLLLQAANIPETKTPNDFYAKGNIITKKPGLTSLDLNTGEKLLLPEGKPVIKDTGEEMKKLIRKGANMPEYSNAIGQKEIPTTVTNGGYVDNARLVKKVSSIVKKIDETKPVDYTVANDYKREFPKRVTPADVGKVPQSPIPKKVAEELPEPTSKIVMNPKKEKLGFKDAWNKFYTRIVDTQNPISKFSKTTKDDTAILASNTRNVGGVVDHIMKIKLVDKSGNVVDKSLKEVAEKIPSGKEEDFWTYMSQRHNIDRARESKPVQANYTPEMSQKAVENFEKANPEWKQIGDDIVNWIDSFMKTWGVDAGTVDANVYKNLREMYKSYFPTQREFSQLEQSIPDGIRRKFVDNAVPLKKATGSERDIINPLENIMNLVNRTVRTAKYNEVGKSLLDSIRKNPEELKKYAEVIPSSEGSKAITDNVVTVLENGKAVYMRINNKALLDAMNNVPKIINNAKAMRAVTGVFKSLITQKNPLFAFRNIFRDVPTSYVYGSTKNPIKFAKDLGNAVKDISTNSERFQKYKAVGGGASNFFDSGNVTKSAKELTSPKSILKKIGEGIETFNNLTETAPRLAEFNRILDKTGDINKALNAANDITVNFARGGDITKKAEPFIPYLNAGVQGLDKFFRGFKDVKTATATLTKAGISITAPTIALYMINKDDPNYQQLDNRTKDTYFLIPKGDGTFIKIPKSRELGVLFGALFERIMRAAELQPDAFKGYLESLGTNFAPANPVENSFFSPATYNLATNKDFANRSIVPQNMVQDKRSPKLQYDEKTSELAKWIGDKTNLSPKQIDYLIKSYTGVIGQVGLPAMTKSTYNKEGNILQNIAKPITSQFTSDPVYSNQIVTDFYDNYDKLQRIASDKNIKENIPSKRITNEESIKNRFGKASDKISKINKQIMANQGNNELIKELRQQIIDIAKQTNDLLNE
jgi:hypothetical protein